MPAVVAEIIRKGPMMRREGHARVAPRRRAGHCQGHTVRLVPDGTLHVKAESQAWIDAVRKSTSLIHIRMGDLLGENLVKRLEFANQDAEYSQMPDCQGS